MLRYLIPAMLLATGARAEPAVFDKPIAQDPENATQRCSYYADLTVRETGTDSPATGPTFLMPPGDTKKPFCPKTGGRKINLQGRDFVGRKGDFLFFVPADANGPELLEVRSLKDGSKLYDDFMVPDAIKSASVSGDQLHLVYTRGYGGSCSILQDGAGCWAKIMKEGKFSKAISQQAPPIEACRASYSGPSYKAPPSVESVVTYDVDVTIERGRKGVVNSRGPIGCQPSL